MRNSFIKIFTVVCIALFSLKGNAQQDPMYTQYMYNMSVINPAYALDDLGMLNVGGVYRNQWAGMDGAPETANFFAHTGLSERIEAGISIVHDEIGDIVKENNLYADVAYVLPVSETSKLSFGVKAGVTFFDANLTALETGNNEQVDPAAQNVSEAFPNFGVGAYWFGDKYYVGLSAPNLFTSKHLENETGLARLGEENIHYFLTGGYVFDLNQNLKLKPAFMARAVEGAPLSVDITANVLLYNRFEAGVAYRFDETVSGLVNFRVTPELRIGYAYDYTTGNLYFLTGGYVFDLNQNLKLKPAFMARAVEGAPLSVDITANVLLYNRFEAGVAYRFDETVSGLVNFRVTPELRIGYAYDYTTGNLSDFNDGTHEIMVLFDLDLLGLSKGYNVSPRFF